MDERHKWQLEYDYYRNKIRKLTEEGKDQEAIQRVRLTSLGKHWLSFW